MFLPGGSHEDVLLVHHPLFSYLPRWFQRKLSVLIVSFHRFKCFSHAGVPLNHPLLAIHLFWSVEDISEDLCLHYQSVQAILRLLSH